jgi:hypothetical protein
MREFAYRPIDTWPQKATPPLHQRSPFSAGFNATLKLLDKELGYLNAKNAVIMLALRESDIRRDGLPRADAKPAHPGVILAFDSKFGPLKLPCDSCRKWTDNLRPIALHLEHLRMSGLYGVGRFGEQYTGWKALPPAGTASQAMTVEQAADLISRHSSTTASAILSSVEAFQAAYRTAIKRLHPDSNGGQTSPDWARLQTAAQLLKQKHGI